MTHQKPRRGSALIMVVICLGVLVVMMAQVVRQGLAQKRFLDQGERRAQAYWLAQAGIEHAAARLLADPQKYAGETIAIIPLSRVSIRVQPRTGRPDSFDITSEATFPSDNVERASIAASRTFRLKRDGSKTHLEVVD